MVVPARSVVSNEADEASDDELIARWIELGPAHRTPERALIAGQAVSVTALINQIRLEGGDQERVAAAYDLPRQAIAGANAYYKRHRASIDAWITLNLARWPA